METLAEVLKFGLRPSSVTFLVVALAFGVLLTWSRRVWRLAPFYWLALLVGYTLLAMPVFAEWFVEQTSGGFHRLDHAAEAHGARTIVVLGAGSRTFRDGQQAIDVPLPATVIRTMEAARLYHLLGGPTVILSGGVTDLATPQARPESESMRAVILRLGVPAERLVLESESTTTEAEARAVRVLLGDRRLDPILLVTSPMHMRRSLAVFRNVGMNPIAAAAPPRSDRSPMACRWCPDDEALRMSDAVIYDQAAWVYYWSRGWVGNP